MNAWRDLRHLPPDLWLLCTATLINRLGTMALPFLALYVTRSLGFSAARAGLVLALYGAVSFIIGPLSGRWADRIGAPRMMLASLLSSGAVLFLFPLAHSWPALLAVTALFSFTNEAFRPAAMSLVGTLGPPEYRKQAFALQRLAVNLGMSVGPAIGGVLAQVSFPALFWTDGATTLLAAAFLAFSPFLKRPRRTIRNIARRTPRPTASPAEACSAPYLRTAPCVWSCWGFCPSASSSGSTNRPYLSTWCATCIFRNRSTACCSPSTQC